MFLKIRTILIFTILMCTIVGAFFSSAAFAEAIVIDNFFLYSQGQLNGATEGTLTMTNTVTGNPNGCGIYYNGATIDLSNFKVTISTTGEAGDGISKKGSGKVTIGDDLKITTRGVTADAINLGRDRNAGTLIVGNNATLETFASAAGKNEGAHGVRSNNPTGDNGVNKIEIGNYLKVTIHGKNSWAVLAGYGSLELANNFGLSPIPDRGKGSSEIIIGNNIILITEGENSYGVVANTAKSKITLGDQLSITTQNTGSTGILSTNGGKVILQGSTKISVISGVNSIEAGKGASVVSEKFDESGKLQNESVFDLNGTLFANESKPGILGTGEFITTSTTGGEIKLRMGGDSVITRPGILETGYQPVLRTSGASSINDALIHIKAFDNTKIIGDVQVAETTKIILDLNDNSVIRGGSSVSTEGTFNVSLSDEAKWEINKNSKATLVEMMNSLASLEFLHDFENPSASFYRLSLDEVSGKGNFFINVDMSNENDPKGDFISIVDANGQFNVSIGHSGVGGAEELEIISVENNPQNLNIYLKDRSVQIGAFRYGLTFREGLNTFGSYWLVFKKEDETIPEKVRDGMFGFWEFAKAVDASISDEMLKTQEGIWAYTFYKKQKFEQEIFKNGFSQQIAGGIAGLNKNLGNNFAVGAFFGLNLGYQTIWEESKGHISDLTAGTYAKLNFGEFNISGYARVSKYIYDLRLKGMYGGDVNGTNYTYGWSASLQTSWKISLFGTRIYLEPKGKLTYTYVEENAFDVGGLKITGLTDKGFVGWIGTRLGIDSKDRNAEYYLEAGFIYDTNPSVVIFTGDEDEEHKIGIGHTRFEVGVGISTAPTETTWLEVDVKIAKGEGILEPIKLQLGASHAF